MGDSSHHSSNISFPMLNRYLSIVYIVRGVFFFPSVSIEAQLITPCPFWISGPRSVRAFQYQVHSLWIPTLNLGLSQYSQNFHAFIVDLGVPGYFPSLYSTMFCEAIHRTFYHDLYFCTMLKMELLSEACGLLYNLDTSLDILGHVFQLYEISIIFSK